MLYVSENGMDAIQIAVNTTRGRIVDRLIPIDYPSQKANTPKRAIASLGGGTFSFNVLLSGLRVSAAAVAVNPQSAIHNAQ